MRLLITTDTVGGVWTFTQELTAGLLARGWSLHLVSLGRRPSSTQQDWLDRAQQKWRNTLSYDALDVPLEWMPENAGAWTEAAPLLMSRAREWGAELLHSNQFCFGALPLDIPKVITAHSDVRSWATCCRSAPLEPCAWLERYEKLVQRGLTGANAVVAPTHWMAAALASAWQLAAKPTVIPNGRSLAGDRSSSSRQLRAVTAGRLWDEAKNIRLLAEVDSPLPLLVAGEIDSHVSRSELPATVTHLGPLAPEDLLALFRASDLYICTSRYEPFGLAPLEAALCGCAVLAHDIAPLREVWGSHALYFHDAASLNALLWELHNNPSQLHAAQHLSLARARCFSAERMVNAYAALFTSALARTPQEAPACPAACA